MDVMLKFKERFQQKFRKSSNPTKYCFPVEMILSIVGMTSLFSLK